MRKTGTEQLEAIDQSIPKVIPLGPVDFIHPHRISETIYSNYTPGLYTGYSGS